MDVHARAISTLLLFRSVSRFHRLFLHNKASCGIRALLTKRKENSFNWQNGSLLDNYHSENVLTRQTVILV